MARLDIFDIIEKMNVSVYRILYLDVDVLLLQNVHNLFSICTRKMLYALKEGIIEHYYYGGFVLFDKEISLIKDHSGFSSGVLLFFSCKEIEYLFRDIKLDMRTRQSFLLFYDQPFIVYHTKINCMCDNTSLESLVTTKKEAITVNTIVIHFCGGVNVNCEKWETMLSVYKKKIIK